MTKPRAKRTTSVKPLRKRPAALPPSDDDIARVLAALVEDGYLNITCEADGDLGEAIVHPVPLERHAPREVEQPARQREDSELLEHGALPDRLAKLLHNQAMAMWQHFKQSRLIRQQVPQDRRKQTAIDAGAIDEDGKAFARWVIVAGFEFAMHRYEEQLKNVPELAQWHRKRAAGGDKGRLVQNRAKTSRAARAQSLLNDGMDVMGIAAELECSVATVYRYLNDTANKGRKRSHRSRQP
jgi:hypothetical protein